MPMNLRKKMREWTPHIIQNINYPKYTYKTLAFSNPKHIAKIWHKPLILKNISAMLVFIFKLKGGLNQMNFRVVLLLLFCCKFGCMYCLFLQVIDTHFPPANKLHKIFNRDTVKVSYSCTQNISQIIKGHNKKFKDKVVKPTPSVRVYLSH